MNINMNKDLLLLIGSVSIMFIAVIVILANSIMSSDRNFDAIIGSEKVINKTVLKLNNQTEILNQLLIGRTALFKQLQNSTNLIIEKIDTAQPQSNFTAQKLATERIANITQDVRDIKQALNISD